MSAGRYYTRVVPMRDLALRLLGTPYKLGAKARDLSRLPGPDEPLDCSGFVHYIVAARVLLLGYPYPLGAGLEDISTTAGPIPISRFHGSWHQGQLCRHIPVADALANVGCLLFKRPNASGHGHVGLSLGAGHTIEAVGGGARMVTLFRPADQERKGWDYGGKLAQLWEQVPC